MKYIEKEIKDNETDKIQQLPKLELENWPNLLTYEFHSSLDAILHTHFPQNLNISYSTFEIDLAFKRLGYFKVHDDKEFIEYYKDNPENCTCLDEIEIIYFYPKTCSFKKVNGANNWKKLTDEEQNLLNGLWLENFLNSD